MIPKIIHYCWFGGKEMPQEFQKYISGWKDLHPDYEFRLWNEDNIPQNIAYVNTALQSKKYANVSNYIRLWAIFHFGGIYLDTDFEIFENLEVVSEHPCFFGKEPLVDGSVIVNNAIIGAIPNHWFMKKCLIEISYQFDGTEAANLSSPLLITTLLNKYGKIESRGDQIIRDIFIYNVNTFYPYHYKEIQKEIRPKGNLGIHHFAYTWKTKKNKLRQVKNIILEYIPEIFLIRWRYGRVFYKKLKNLTVNAGPFKSLKFHSLNTNGSAIFPKIIGSYEECLHKSIYKFQLKRYDNIYNLGAGEGYYTIGLHLFFKPQNRSIAYEADKSNFAYLIQNIAANMIDNQIIVRNEFANDTTLLEIKPGERSFIFCDIEGHESNVFNLNIVENIRDCDLIIEIHDFIDYHIFSTLIDLFNVTHSIEVVKEDEFNNIKSRHLMSTKRSYWQYDLINERRPEAMRWLVLESKNKESVF